MTSSPSAAQNVTRQVVVGEPGVALRIEDVVQVAKGGGASWMQASGTHSWAAKSELPAASVAIHPEAIKRLEEEAAAPDAAEEPPPQQLSPPRQQQQQSKQQQQSQPQVSPSEPAALLHQPGSPSEAARLDPKLPYLSGVQSRAVVFVRLVTVINGQTRIRMEVVKKLVEMLNVDRPIRIRASERDDTVLAEIVRLIISEEFGPKVELTAHEEKVLMSGQIPTVGLGAITVIAAKGLQKAALAISALACEALQADMTGIEAEVVSKVCSQDAVQVCLALQELLNESELVNSTSGFESNEGISMVPAVHGELTSAISRCEEAVTIALRIISTHPLQMLQLGPAIGLPVVLLYLATLLVRSAELSLKRSELMSATLDDMRWIPHELRSIRQFFLHASALRDTAQSVVSAEVGRACFSGALAGWAGITALVNALAIESAIVLLSLRKQEAQTQPKQRAKGREWVGLPLGRGTGHLRQMLEESMTDFRGLQRVVQLLSKLQGDRTITEGQLRIQAMLAALDPIGDQLPRKLSELTHFLASQTHVRGSSLPAGLQDLTPAQVVLRQRHLSKVVAVFKRHGGVPLDQPALLKREQHSSLYHEGPHKIFHVKGNAAEMLSLRYDLTLSLARFVAEHNMSNMKCYQIAKVYRREAEFDVEAGTLREFYQCDFDIVGNSPRMIADAEVLKILVEVLDQLISGRYCIRVNHRVLLHSILTAAKVPAFKHEELFQSYDSRGLSERRQVQKMQNELFDQHGVLPEVTEQIVRLTSRRGPPTDILDELSKPETGLAGGDACSSAIADLRTVFELVESMGCLDRFEVDLSVVGGLDYYTGIVFEVYRDAPDDQKAVAAGGRYDNLISVFGEKQVRAVGFSVGFDRLFPGLLQVAASVDDKIRESKTEVLVMSVGKSMQRERMKLANELWMREVGTEFSHQKANPFLPEQISYAISQNIPLGVIMAPRELAEGKVELMEVGTGERKFVGREEIVGVILQRLEEIGPLTATFTPPAPR